MIEMENYHEYCQHRKKNMYAYKSSMFLNKNVRLKDKQLLQPILQLENSHFLSCEILTFQ